MFLLPDTFFLYSSGLCKYIAAASPLSGSMGFGYVSNCGRNDSKIFDRSRKEQNKQFKMHPCYFSNKEY